MDSYGSINGSYAQTSQHGFRLPEADLAVTEFLKHERTDEWWVSHSGNVSQWSSQVTGTPPIISEPFHCRGDKVLILLRYSSTLDIDLPSCLHYFGQNKYVILYRKYAYWQRILHKATLEQRTSLGMTTLQGWVTVSHEAV